MFPNKIRPSDEIRVVAPSKSMSVLTEEQVQIAVERLKKLGLQVTFGKHVMESDEFSSSSITSRVEDLHDAFRDPNVKGILTSLGGHNCNQLLRYLDYSLIAQNPKVLCGYSDITALSNAIYAKTGMVSYSGPHFSSFGMLKDIEYTIEYFSKCVMEEPPFQIAPPQVWSDDPWYLDQENRTFYPHEGWLTLHEGEAEGTLIGGNLCTLNLLHGTEYMPDLKDSILFIEDDYSVNYQVFDRDLQSVLHLPSFSGVKAVLIGRFQKQSQVSDERLKQIIATKKELAHLPVVGNIDFGHTNSRCTLPVGGRAKVVASQEGVQFEILNH
ncbi:S66 family peptidase [Hazenella coriacea]|uniref:S66 family peptidase n=1 Tax=Hazenella coriacea TaxID=1179467 RepID=UPI00104B3163|nr:S66 peptidase family protein [Hazenella coriacea]